MTCKNRLPYNLYCVGGDVKHCSLTHTGHVSETFSPAWLDELRKSIVYSYGSEKL